jgi:hypothetical protein
LVCIIPQLSKDVCINELEKERKRIEKEKNRIGKKSWRKKEENRIGKGGKR